MFNEPPTFLVTNSEDRHKDPRHLQAPLVGTWEWGSLLEVVWVPPPCPPHFPQDPSCQGSCPTLPRTSMRQRLMERKWVGGSSTERSLQESQCCLCCLTWGRVCPLASSIAPSLCFLMKLGLQGGGEPLWQSGGARRSPGHRLCCHSSQKLSFCLLFFPRGRISKFWKVSLFASKGKAEQRQKKEKASVHLLFGENLRPVTTTNINCGGWPQPCGRPSRPHENPGNLKWRRLWCFADFHWRVL